MTLTPLCIAYYQGAYGPTIRIDAQKKEHLLLLRGIFLRLVNNQSEEVKIDVGHFPIIQFLGLDNLVLKVRPDSHNSPHGPETHHPITLIKKLFFMKPGSLKTLTAAPSVDEAPCFIWEQKSEDWGDCMKLVDKLFEQIVPCHYYLTQEGVDDALIELSYLEPRSGRFESVSN